MWTSTRSGRLSDRPAVPWWRIRLGHPEIYRIVWRRLRGEERFRQDIIAASAGSARRRSRAILLAALGNNAELWEIDAVVPIWDTESQASPWWRLRGAVERVRAAVAVAHAAVLAFIVAWTR